MLLAELAAIEQVLVTANQLITKHSRHRANYARLTHWIAKRERLTIEREKLRGQLLLCGKASQ